MAAFAIVVGVLMLLVVVCRLFHSVRTSRRRRYSETYEFPETLADKLYEHHPELTAHDLDRVLAALREWFIACLLAEDQMIGMPSRVVDDAWHEFILMTRRYHAF